MINISALNTIIAMVILLLVLSLMVQSIQSLVKKMFKLKSSVFVNSIIDLFEYVDSQNLLGKKPQELLDLVKEEYRKLGRETLFGRPMLDSISKEDLVKIVNRIVATHPELKDKFNPATIREELEKWFETVMQGFNERYTRHMKSVAVIIAFLVVVVLNANIFTIYRNIATNDVLQARILSMSDQVQKQAADAAAAAKKEQANAKPNPSPIAAPTPVVAEPGPNPAAGSSPEAQSTTTTTSSSSSDQTNKQAEEAKQNAKEIEGYLRQSQELGFSPLKPKQVYDFVWGQGVWAGEDKPFFWVRAAHGAKVLLGWLIMTLLLSVGAPFWQDALESLFGLKGLIRKQGETQNVEQGEGGQQKP